MRRKTYLSINHICLFLGLVLGMAAIGCSILVLWITQNVTAALYVLGFWGVCLWMRSAFCKDCPEKIGLIFRPAL